jgi:V8-like Glu-specific endopeptidase
VPPSGKPTRSRTFSARSPRKRLDAPPQFLTEPLVGDDASNEIALYSPSFMLETHLGGCLEKVEGFPTAAALYQGFDARVITPTSRMMQRPGPMVPPPPLVELHPERHFGEGERWTQITNTAGVPWRCICQLEVTYEDGRSAVGTGWFSAPGTVITAGHNLYIPEVKVGAAHIRIVPGRNGNFGPFGETFAEEVEVSQGWISEGSPEHDYGMIRTNNPVIGNATGWFGCAVLTDQNLGQGPLVQSAGYPNQTRPYGTQWYDAGRAKRQSAAFIGYRVDTEEGQSGAPVFFTNASGQRWVVAIHVYSDASSNLGLRITEDIFARIQSWSKQ